MEARRALANARFSLASPHRRIVVFEEIEGQPVIASGGVDGKVRLWDPGGQQLLATVDLGASVEEVVADFDEGFVVALSRGLVVFDLSPPLLAPPARREA